MAITLAKLVAEISSKGIGTTQNKIKRLGDEGTRTKNKLNSINNVVSRSMKRLKNRIAGLALAYISLNTVKNLALEGARFETINVVLETVGRNAGYTAEQIQAVALSVQKSGIEMTKSREVVTRLVQAQIDLSNASKLARVAQDAAVIGNINSTEAFERLIHGITAGQTIVLRNIGINVSFQQSYKKLAKELGKTAGSLTEYEKVQARANAVMGAGEKIAGTYGAAMSTAGKQISSVPRLLADLKTELGSTFNETTSFLVLQFSQNIKDLTEKIRELKNDGTLRTWGRNIGKTIATVQDIFKGATKAAALFVQTLDVIKQGADFNISSIAEGVAKLFPDLQNVIKTDTAKTEVELENSVDTLNAIIEDIFNPTIIKSSVQQFEESLRTFRGIIDGEKVTRVFDTEAQFLDFKKAIDGANDFTAAANRASDAKNKLQGDGKGISEGTKKAIAENNQLIEQLKLQISLIGKTAEEQKKLSLISQVNVKGSKNEIEAAKELINTFVELTKIEEVRSKNKTIAANEEKKHQGNASLIQSLKTEIRLWNLTARERFIARKELELGTNAYPAHIAEVRKLADALFDLEAKGESTADKMIDAIKGFGDELNSVLVDMVVTGEKNFKDLADIAIREFLRIQFQSLLIDPFVSFAQGITGTIADSFASGSSTGSAATTDSSGLVTDFGSVFDRTAPTTKAPTVQVFDYRSASQPDVEVQSSTSQTGEDFIKIIVKENFDSLNASGDLDKSFQTNQGLSRRSIRR